jgi:hypothetical protein
MCLPASAFGTCDLKASLLISCFVVCWCVAVVVEDVLLSLVVGSRLFGVCLAGCGPIHAGFPEVLGPCYFQLYFLLFIVAANPKRKQTNLIQSFT